jgi:hypothetical protein
VCSIAEFCRIKMTSKEPSVVKFAYKIFTLVNENEEGGSSSAESGQRAVVIVRRLSRRPGELLQDLRGRLNQ